MSRPKVIQDAPELTEPLQFGPKLKHLFMAISPTGVSNEFGADAPSIVEAEVEKWLSKGYELILVQHIRTERREGNQPVGEQMLYVLYKAA